MNGALASIRGNQMAKGGVEAAVWDLEAKLAGRPLWEVSEARIDALTTKRETVRL